MRARFMRYLPIRLIMAVIRNSTNPIAMSDDSRNPSASPNWFAIMLAIEFPVSVIEPCIYARTARISSHGLLCGISAAGIHCQPLP